VREAHAWLDNHYELLLSTPYNEGTRWALPASPVVLKGLMTDYADPNAYPVDGRGVTYSYAFFSPKHLGKGQFYLMNIADKDGNHWTVAARIACTCRRTRRWSYLVGDGL